MVIKLHQATLATITMPRTAKTQAKGIAVMAQVMPVIRVAQAVRAQIMATVMVTRMHQATPVTITMPRTAETQVKGIAVMDQVMPAIRVVRAIPTRVKI